MSSQAPPLRRERELGTRVRVSSAEADSTRIARLSPAASLGLVVALTLAWGVLMSRFEQGGVYWTMGVYALAVAAVLGFVYGPRLRRLFRPSARDVALGVSVGAGMTLATYPAYALALRLFPGLESRVVALYAESRQEALVVALAWVVVILVVEELLFRAAWIEALRSYVSPPVAAALSLSLYAIAQLGSGSAIVGLLALCCGGLWTVLRMWSGSLWPPVLAHMIWTPIVIILYPIA